MGKLTPTLVANKGLAAAQFFRRITSTVLWGDCTEVEKYTLRSSGSCRAWKVQPGTGLLSPPVGTICLSFRLKSLRSSPVSQNANVSGETISPTQQLCPKTTWH